MGQQELRIIAKARRVQDGIDSKDDTPANAGGLEISFQALPEAAAPFDGPPKETTDASTVVGRLQWISRLVGAASIVSLLARMFSIGIAEALRPLFQAWRSLVQWLTSWFNSWIPFEITDGVVEFAIVDIVFWGILIRSAIRTDNRIWWILLPRSAPEDGTKAPSFWITIWLVFLATWAVLASYVASVSPDADFILYGWPGALIVTGFASGLATMGLSLVFWPVLVCFGYMRAESFRNLRRWTTKREDKTDRGNDLRYSRVITSEFVLLIVPVMLFYALNAGFSVF